MIGDGRAIFQQIADHVADSIIDGTLEEDTKAPSANELAAFYRINPATAAKGINLLVDKGVLTKGAGSACSSPSAPENFCAGKGKTCSPIATSNRCSSKPAAWA